MSFIPSLGMLICSSAAGGGGLMVGRRAWPVRTRETRGMEEVDQLLIDDDYDHDMHTSEHPGV